MTVPVLITLGTDEDGVTYTLSGRTGLMIMSGETVHSYTRRSKCTYFTPALTEHPRRTSQIREEWGEDDGSQPYDRIMIIKTKCEQKCIGGQAKNYTKYKLYMFQELKCFVRKFVYTS